MRETWLLLVDSALLEAATGKMRIEPRALTFGMLACCHAAGWN